MDDRVMQFRVGVVVLATLLIAGILLVLFDEVPKLGFGKKVYKLNVHFESVPGVSPGTPVRKSGMLIGRVSDLRFAEDGGAIVTMDIDEDVKLYSSDMCRLRVNFIGDASLEFYQMGKPKDPGELLSDSDEIQRGVVFNDPMEVLQNLQGDMKISFQKISQAGDDVSQLARSLSKIVNDKDGNVGSIVKKMDESLSEFSKVMKSLDTIIGDKDVQESLRNSLKEMPAMITQVKSTLTDFQNTVKKADENLSNLKKFTKPLGENGEEMVTNVNKSVTHLEELLGQMAKLSNSLNSDKGSFGQLIKNPDLYQNMNRATKNIEEATQMLKPIMRDARLFMDTLNRHPGKIIRDAIKPGSGTKGFSSEGNRRLLYPQNRTQTQQQYYYESQRRNRTTTPRANR